VLAHRVTEARARYNAMTLRFDKRIRDNWGMNANYTYGRLMDNQFGESNTYSARSQNALDTYDLDREWGYSLLDVPHRLNVNGTFVLPVGDGHRWLTMGIATRSGVSVTMAALPDRLPASVWQPSNNSGQLAAQRPNIVPGVELATSGSLEERLTVRSIPPRLPRPPHLGNAPRTLDLSPGQRNVDPSVQKMQRLGGQTISASGRDEPRQPALHDPAVAVRHADVRQLTAVGATRAR
jgi:hypothetical protein